MPRTGAADHDHPHHDHPHDHPRDHRRDGGPSVDVEALLDRLRHDGERVTTARRVVLEELAAASGTHLPVEELAARVQARHPEIHLSTVYRTLDFLSGTGILVSVRVGPGPASYHFAGDAHHHAVCDRCGASVELPAALLAPLVRRLDKDHGFAADPRHLVITGLCARCRPTPET